jgi:hypothetical protein
MRKRPKSFTIKVFLKKVTKWKKQITKLEINQKEFILEVKGRYYLDIKMPLPVLKGQIQPAKFDKKTRTLKVKMMVDKKALEAKDRLELEQREAENEDSDIEVVKEGDETDIMDSLRNIDPAQGQNEAKNEKKRPEKKEKRPLVQEIPEEELLKKQIE